MNTKDCFHFRKFDRFLLNFTENNRQKRYHFHTYSTLDKLGMNKKNIMTKSGFVVFGVFLMLLQQLPAQHQV